MTLSTPMIYLSGDGHYSLAVVGESHYQHVLLDIAGPYTETGRSVRCFAVLCPEDDNRHDPHAVRVEIGGDTVGYISRQQNQQVRFRLEAQRQNATDRFYVDAVIRGGRIGQHYGVWLDLPLTLHQPSNTIYPLNYYEPDMRAGASMFSTAKTPVEPPTPVHKYPSSQPGATCSTITIWIASIVIVVLLGYLLLSQ